MREQTDLEAIKKLAHTFLYLEPEPTKIPFVIKHPFTDSGFIPVNSPKSKLGIANITDDESALKMWRDMISDMIKKAEKADDISMLLTKSYRFAFLKHAMPYLSRKDFSEYLADAWVTCEAPNSDPNFTKKQLLGLFKKADPQFLMTAEEYEQFQGLDETVTVYRGVTGYNAHRVKALSWTLDKDKAEWFAHRFGEDGTVYEAQISKEHILAFFDSRNESEVIVDPGQLIDITEVQDMDSGFTMTM